jgi:hypothetical protein
MRQFHMRARNVAFLLVFISVALYGADYLAFGKAGDIVSSFMGNLAFLPLYVLFVTLVIERILKERERLVLRQKMNMAIGVFFSEVGSAFLRNFAGFLANHGELSSRLRVNGSWSDAEFRSAEHFLNGFDMQVDVEKGDLRLLKLFLVERRPFMLRLLENPNLLEHDEFTDLLWAVFHLVEELEARPDLDGLPLADREHISGDLRRVFISLTREWLRYMNHLLTGYPYLFSLAVRTNPLNPEARAEVE